MWDPRIVLLAHKIREGSNDCLLIKRVPVVVAVGRHQGRRLSGEVRAGSATLPQLRGSDVVDYYELLGVRPPLSPPRADCKVGQMPSVKSPQLHPRFPIFITILTDGLLTP